MNFNKIKSLALSGMLAAASVAGSFSAATPTLTSNAAGNDYARLLQYSLYFFDANMCGDDVQSKGTIEWRGNCHTDDAVPGGYHDAGDHVMFGLPQGFAASTLGWSYYEFKDAYEASGQAEHLKMITDRFCDFFRRSAKMSGDTISEFLYQKGSGPEDHGYWGPPEHQGSGRRMYWTGSTGGDIAAEYAAALAANYVNFGNEQDLKYAKAYYNYAKSHNSVATDGPIEGGQSFYKNGGAGDEIAWAAGWLYLATKDGSYKSEVGNYNSYLGWVHGWETVDLGAACLDAEINGNWNTPASYMSGKCSGSNYMCLDDWGSARLNTSMQFTALVATKHGAANLGSWAQGQMDYILGNNSFNVCFVTGFKSNSAKNVHHRAASGYEGYNPPDGMNEYTETYHASKSHVLIGALTGGPNKAGQYRDVMNDYQCNEVAIDYQASLVGAAAGLCSLYGKDGAVDTSITGVKKVWAKGSSSTTTPDPTDPPKTTQGGNNNPNPTVTTTKAPSTSNPGTSSDGAFEIKPAYEFDYAKTDENDRMIGWEWADFGLTAKDVPTKVEVDISASGNIGKWQGAFGSSTTVAPDYWTMTDEMQQNCSGNKATITWNIDAATQKIIQTQYNGEVKFGTWWVDCQKFTIDAVRVYTSGGSTSTPQTTKAPVTTVKTTTTTKPTTTQAPVTQAPQTQAPQTQPTQAPVTQAPQQGVSVTIYGDANCDGYVGIADATAILQHIGNQSKYGLSKQGIANADVVQPAGLSGNDALAIQCYDAKLIQYSQFPLAQLPNF